MVDEALSTPFPFDAKEGLEFSCDLGGGLAVTQGGGSMEAAATSMEWAERQGSNVDGMDIEVGSCF